MTKSWPSLAVLAAALALPSQALAEDPTVSSLKALRGVRVVIDITCNDAGFNQMITEESVRTAVELKLRKAGVRVVDPDDHRSDNDGSLSVSMAVLPVGEASRYAIATRVEVLQVLWRVKAGKPIQAVVGSTWLADGILLRGREVIQSEGADGILSSDTDRFLNAWLATHPK